MDFFGISAAIRGVTQIYFRGAQRSGRTTALLSSLKPGDVVVFSTADQARHFLQLCRDRNITGVKALSVPPGQPERVFERSTAEGRLIWDHDWLEAHYTLMLEDTEKRLAKISEQSSGFGETHHQTRLQAQAIRDWVIR